MIPASHHFFQQHETGHCRCKRSASLDRNAGPGHGGARVKGKLVRLNGGQHLIVTHQRAVWSVVTLSQNEEAHHAIACAPTPMEAFRLQSLKA